MINTKALARSTVWTVILITVLTVWAELSKPFKEFLVGIGSHHWIAKSIISAIFFVILYFIFSRIYKKSADVKKEVNHVLWTAVLGGLVIFIFYIWHFYS